jgi:hypothetical protein
MGLLQTLEYDAAEGIYEIAESNTPVLEAAVGAGESWVVGWVVTLIKGLPKVQGAIGYVANPLLGDVETYLENKATALLQSETPAAIVAWGLGILGKAVAKLAPPATPAPPVVAGQVAPVAAVKPAPPTTGIIGAP